MAEPLVLAFTSPAGGEIGFEWSPAALAALDPSAAEPAWRMTGTLDWDAVEAVRLFGARLDDERALAITAVRPAGAGGHGEEAISGVLASGTEAEQLDRVLLSVEHGRGGKVLRVGLELYRAESELPLRVAADATGSGTSFGDGIRTERTTLDVRAQGSGGFGVYEVLRRA